MTNDPQLKPIEHFKGKWTKLIKHANQLVDCVNCLVKKFSPFDDAGSDTGSSLQVYATAIDDDGSVKLRVLTIPGTKGEEIFITLE